jgi:hypothetical protein
MEHHYLAPVKLRYGIYILQFIFSANQPTTSGIFLVKLFSHQPQFSFVRLAYQSPVSSTFISYQISISHHTPASQQYFFSQQISTSHQQPPSHKSLFLVFLKTYQKFKIY